LRRPPPRRILEHPELVMFSPDDTIVALATPPGRAGLAVVRLSGPRARTIAGRLIEGATTLEPRHATLVRLRSEAPAGGGLGLPPGAIDEAVVTLFAAPASYTGDDVVEFSVHGSPVVVGELVGAAVAAGARAAGRGEFTLRAFLNGRLDLTRAEAVRDLVESTTPLQARMALDQLQGTLAERIGEIEKTLFDLTARLEASGDFPEEGYHFITPDETLLGIRSAVSRMEALLAESKRGRLLREGITVAIAGRPNVGKSTLFNRLSGVERAIVTEVPGTTRDLLTEAVMLLGARVTLVDTAGLRTTNDPVEREGVARAEKAMAAADVVLVVLDSSTPLVEDDRRLLEMTARRARLVVVNKCDMATAWEPGERLAVEAGESAEAAITAPAPGAPVAPPRASGAARSAPHQDVAIRVSATTGAGIEDLIRSIAKTVGVSGSGELPHLSNIRQIDLLGQSTETLRRIERAVSAAGGQFPEELVLADLRIATDYLQEVTGQRTTEDLLEAIFSTFCIGK
jgi:tRNA modification GTPase